MAASPLLHLFEHPCPPNWVYPCTLEDITFCLARLPEQDLEGLGAVGLMPSTRKDNDAYGRYHFTPKPTIQLFSYPACLRFKLRSNTKKHDIKRALAAEIQHGMGIEREGSRYVCAWSTENLRRFMVEHVLLHEVGHHVYFWNRKKQGLPYSPDVAGAEQFAEHYALRHSPKGCDKSIFS